MPHLRVVLYEGRTVEKKQELAARLTDAVCEVLGVTPQDVSIILDECKKENWASGGLLACNRPPKK